jgi:hypothetical protein
MLDRYFTFQHLAEGLQQVSRPFCDLAHHLAAMPHEDPAELTVSLRKLLEAKDAAVRSVLK